MFKLRKTGRGFTLLELLMTVIIIGILGALALPNYMKAQQRSYAAEAWSNLSVILKGAKAYYADHAGITPPWTTSISLLPIENPNSMANAKFSYGITASASAPWSVVITAVPNSVTRTGTTRYRITCASCYDAAESLSRSESIDGGTNWPAVSN